MVVGEPDNKSGRLNNGSIVMDLIGKQPFGSANHEKMVNFVHKLKEINPELFNKLMTI
ncbi:hypothetical protein D3C76_01670 [compost metagenome]